MNSHHLPIQYADDREEREIKWERHVMAVLWIALALVLAVSLALVFAEAHGSFQSAPDRPTQAMPDEF